MNRINRIYDALVNQVPESVSVIKIGEITMTE